MTRSSLRSLAPVLLVAMMGAVLINVTWKMLRDDIEAGEKRRHMQPVFDVMPLPHDNDLLADHITLNDLEQDEPARVFRARNSGQPVGVVVMPVLARGYNGNIELAVGIAFDGALTGVHVVQHRETPGLGDQIHHQKSDWLNQFPGHSRSSTPAEAWAVKPDGGQFDGISGATITPRGVIRAVHKLLARYDSNPESFYR
jgi:Na+-translocating ferredoxin:NAD+ oxidoreductase subunit G